MNKNQIGYVYSKDGVTFIIEKIMKIDGVFKFKIMYKNNEQELDKWKTLRFSDESQEVVQSTYWHWIDYLSDRGLSTPKSWEKVEK